MSSMVQVRAGALTVIAEAGITSIGNFALHRADPNSAVIPTISP